MLIGTFSKDILPHKSVTGSNGVWKIILMRIMMRMINILGRRPQVVLIGRSGLRNGFYSLGTSVINEL